MNHNNEYPEIDKAKQNQMLKLVTNSFYKELVNYGVDDSDIVTVSVNLLDYVTDKKSANYQNNGYYNSVYNLGGINDQWQSNRKIQFNGVEIQPLQRIQIDQVVEWLKNSEISQTFISFFPKEAQKLATYFLEHPDREYFAIIYEQKHFVGLIGAENINPVSKKLEMKKFVGADEFQGKGIGKLATFLFLYYAFHILEFNKIYIHSLDTNIKNINLNSKFGFELEGILYREAFLNNAYCDVLRMGLLKSTWDSIFVQPPPTV